MAIDALLDKGLKALTTDMFLANSGCLLVCEEPCKHVFIGVKTALLVGHVVTRARLLVQLGQTVRSLLEAILQGDQVQLSRYLRRLIAAYILLLMVGHGVQVLGGLMLLQSLLLLVI